jgi:hypothetical protein
MIAQFSLAFSGIIREERDAFFSFVKTVDFYVGQCPRALQGIPKIIDPSSASNPVISGNIPALDDDGFRV